MISIGESLRIGVRCVPSMKRTSGSLGGVIGTGLFVGSAVSHPFLGSRLVRHVDRLIIVTIGRTTQRRTYWRLVRLYAHGFGRVLPMRLGGGDDSVSVSWLLEDRSA